MLVVTISRSEIKFAVYAADKSMMPIFDGEIERMGTKNTAFSFTDNCTKRSINFCFFSADCNDAVSFMLGLLEKQKSFTSVKTARFTIAADHETMLIENTSIDPLYNGKTQALHAFQYLPDENKLKELLRQRCPGLKHLIFADSYALTSFPAFVPEGNKELLLRTKYLWDYYIP